MYPGTQVTKKTGMPSIFPYYQNRLHHPPYFSIFMAPTPPSTPPPQPIPQEPPKRKYVPRTKHYDTPIRSKIQGVVEFCEAKDVELYFNTPLKQKASKFFHVTATQGYEIIKSSELRMRCYQDLNETRGRPLKVQPE